MNKTSKSPKKSQTQEPNTFRMGTISKWGLSHSGKKNSMRKGRNGK